MRGLLSSWSLNCAGHGCRGRRHGDVAATVGGGVDEQRGRAVRPLVVSAQRPRRRELRRRTKSTLRNSLLLFRVLIVVSSLVSVLGYAGGQGSEVQFNDAVDCYEKAFACLLPTIDPTVTAVLPLRIGGTSSPFAAAARPLPLLRQLPPLL
jgi:hypothetical protein